jgi:NADH-quinone oxidoreductase subunit F
LQAIQCGGAAGTFLRPDDLDLALSFEDLRGRGATVGSGAIVVMDDTVSLLDMVRRTAEFFAHESCGQCVPCRVGTVRQLELLDRPDQRGLLADVGQVMRDASICGLGQTASSAVLSAFKEFGL